MNSKIEKIVLICLTLCSCRALPEDISKLMEKKISPSIESNVHRCEFKGLVHEIKQILEYNGDVICAHFDPQWVVIVTIEDDTVACLPIILGKKTIAIAIHSPIRLFRMSEKEIIGRTFKFILEEKSEGLKKRYLVSVKQE